MPTAPTPAELPQPIKKELTAPNHQCHKPGRQPETLASGRDHLGTAGDIIPESRATSCRNTRATSSESLRVQIGPGARAPAIAVRRDLFEAGLNEAAVESGSASMGVRWLRRSDIDGCGE